MLIMRGYQGTHPISNCNYYEYNEQLTESWNYISSRYTALYYSAGQSSVFLVQIEFQNDLLSIVIAIVPHTTPHHTGYRLPNIEYLILSPQRSIKFTNCSINFVRWVQITF